LNISFKPSASPPFVHQLKISIFFPSATATGAAVGAAGSTAAGAAGAAQAPKSTAPTINPFTNLDVFIFSSSVLQYLQQIYFKKPEFTIL
jgi:hypothetical protein